jgi:hypothetical protein
MAKTRNTPTNHGTDKLPHAEGAKLLWEEWSYRHELFWRSLYRWGGATVAVSIVPYVNPDLIKDLGVVVLVFPFLSFSISIFAAWHLSAEYARLTKVTEKLREVQGRYAPQPIDTENLIIRLILRLKIGWVVPISFIVVAIPLSVLNAILLISLLIRSWC